MTTNSKQPTRTSTHPKLIALGATAAILASCYWIYHSEFGLPDINLPLQQSIGMVMADETFHEVGHLGKIVIVTMSTRQSPELKVQVDAFQKHLKTLGGLTIADKVVLDPGENPKYRAGSGLSTKRFLKIARKHAGVDAIVSFVGAPEVTDEQLKQLKSVPKFIAETRSYEALVTLREKKVMVSAIVPRFEFPAPGPRQPQTPQQWFDHYFQVVHANTPIPKADEAP